MRVLIAFDKFKDSLTAPAACAAAAAGLQARHPDWTLDLCPLADGGEGFAEILVNAAGGEWQPRTVTGPLGESRTAAYGRVRLARIPPAAQALLALPPADSAKRAADPWVAVIEMAAASGLALVPPLARDPWATTSRGTGELMQAAASAGAAAIVLGVGGSATHDLGVGALSALGLEFWTAAGQAVPLPTPARWEEVARLSGRPLALPPVRIACDVANPLLGPTGAAAVYGPQKGLRPADYARLERLSEQMAGRLAAQCGQSLALARAPGAGAAGGIAFGLMTAEGAVLLPGFGLIGAWIDLEARLAAADLVITGEGRFDASSRDGKGPGALAGRAQSLGKSVHIFAGQVTVAAPEWPVHAITPPGTPLAEALQNAERWLAAAVAGVL